MDSNGIVKSFDIFKHESVSVFQVEDPEAAQPFSFDQGVK